MGRKLRVQYPGAIYHVMNRGPQRVDILRIDRLLGERGIRWDQPGAAGQFSAAMEARRQGELEEQFKPVRAD